MPLRINGHEISWTSVVGLITFTFWLGGLSWQVYANASEIQKQLETKERLARIEQRQEEFKKDIEEIKQGQESAGRDTVDIKVTLARILAKINEG